MRNRIRQNKRLVFAGICILMLLVATTPSLSKEAKKAAICPFTMNSPQDLGYLQNGLFDMLYTRLADPGKVIVLDRETVDAAIEKSRSTGEIKGAFNEAKARIIGQRLEVDYILFGSVNIFGQSVSLDAGMVDMSGVKPTLTFFKQSDKMGDVIPMVNAFAGDVNLKVFKRAIDNELYTPEARKLIASGAIRTDGRGSILYDQGFVNLQRNNIDGFQTHLRFKGQINAMAVGDLNNDDTIQVVTATESEIIIYKFEGSKLVVDKKLPSASSNRIVALDVADINNNGFPEIFVTSLNIHRQGLQSFVLEYDGKKYQTLTDGEHYYYRVVDNHSNSKILLGQRSVGHPFKGNIYIMAAAGNRYKEQKRLQLPRGASALSIAQGAITSDDVDETVLMDKDGHLVITRDSGRVEWKGSRTFGGIMHYILLEKKEYDVQEHVYLNPRVQFYDVGGDGKSNVITIQNEEQNKALGSFKRFKKGSIEIHSWDGIALYPVFRTRSVQGWISDFAVIDIDGDGNDELLAAVCGPIGALRGVMQGGKSQSSNIISYELGTVK